MNEDMECSLEDYRDSLIGGLHDEDEINEIIDEMKKAKVGTIKANCWEKLSDDRFLIYYV